MDRVEEAMLAFIGTGEVCKRPMLMSEQRDKIHIHVLIAEGMAELVGDELRVTIKGWRFLDSRPQ